MFLKQAIHSLNSRRSRNRLAFLTKASLTQLRDVADVYPHIQCYKGISLPELVPKLDFTPIELSNIVF